MVNSIGVRSGIDPAQEPPILEHSIEFVSCKTYRFIEYIKIQKGGEKMSRVIDRDCLNHKNVNNIIMAHGVQKGIQLLFDAFGAHKKVDYVGGVVFPTKLSSYAGWVIGLSCNEASDLLEYARHASSLAYRYRRKKR